MSAILTLWHLLNLWHKTDLGGPTWVIMKGLLSLFMHAERCVHRVVRQMIGWINIIQISYKWWCWRLRPDTTLFFISHWYIYSYIYIVSAMFGWGYLVFELTYNELHFGTHPCQITTSTWGGHVYTGLSRQYSRWPGSKPGAQGAVFGWGGGGN